MPLPFWRPCESDHRWVPLPLNGEWGWDNRLYTCADCGIVVRDP